MTSNLHTAEELVQEAFLRAMLHENVLAGLQEHTLLIVNGSLNIHPGTEETLAKYKKYM